MNQKIKKSKIKIIILHPISPSSLPRPPQVSIAAFTRGPDSSFSLGAASSSPSPCRIAALLSVSDLRRLLHPFISAQGFLG
ncbi:unnamed protein product [Citrullus colocynthis]|uniref:Uncharacterized protein n=1 Tax=Citrullus colocynthis TaxID=252529 RepID=A0ABP0Z2Q5_9ROSI